MRESYKIRRNRLRAATPVDWTPLEAKARAFCRSLKVQVKFCRTGLRRKWEFAVRQGDAPYLEFFPTWNTYIAFGKSDRETRGSVGNPAQAIVLASALLQEITGRKGKGPIRVPLL